MALSKAAKRIFVISLVWAVFFVRSYAQDNTWRSFTEQAFRLYKEKEYKEATAVTEKALKIAKKEFGEGSLEVAESLGNLAALYDIQGEAKEAEPFFEQARTIREKHGERGIPLGIQTEVFFKKVAQGRMINRLIGNKDEPQLSAETPSSLILDLDRNGECNANDFKMCERLMGKCLQIGVADKNGSYDYDPRCDRNADYCITEQDRKIFLQEIEEYRKNNSTSLKD
jgi:tetratricopeptide (TPR) repeat protein